MEKLKEYLKEGLSVDDLKEMVSLINSCNGELDYLVYHYNDEDFFEVFFKDKIDVARAICYGDYNFMHDYVRFDGYGNLKSVSLYEYDVEIEDAAEEIIEAFLELYEEDSNYCKYSEAYNLIEQYSEENE